MIDVTLYRVQVEDYYCWGADKGKFLEERKKFLDVGLEVNEWVEGTNNQQVTDQTHIVDQVKLTQCTLAGIRFSAVNTITTSVNIAEQLHDMSAKSIPIGAPSHNEYNTLCEVHMPGQALSMYNDVKLLEDSCSDVLQEALNEGWRIVAACPQPSARRPDYILGRFDPRHNGDRSAKR